MKQLLILLSVILSVCATVYGQADADNREIDSLKAIVSTQRGVEKMKTLNTISNKLQYTAVKQSKEYILDAINEGREILREADAIEVSDDFFYVYAQVCNTTARVNYLTLAAIDTTIESRRSISQKIIDFATQAEWAYKKIKDKKGGKEDALIQINLCQSHMFKTIIMEEPDSSLYYISQAEEIAIENDLPEQQAVLLQNKGTILGDMGMIEESKSCFMESIRLTEKFDTPFSRKSLPNTYCGLAATLVNSGRYEEGEKYIYKAIELGKKWNNLAVLYACYGGLSEIGEAQHNYKKAYDNLLIYNAYQDTLYKKESSEQINLLEVQYKTAKKEAEINSLEKENRAVVYAAVSLVIVVLLVLLYAELRRRANMVLTEKNKQISEQRDQIASQKEEIEAQRDELDTMLTDISLNISYASMLQSRIMLGDRKVVDVVDEVFLIYAPKDVVSGDFFFIKQCGDYKVVAVADCTGHSISAALLTVMNITFLNEYFADLPQEANALDTYFDPANILEKLRQDVKTLLYSQDSSALAMSGMDMALLVHKQGESTIRFAGANRPLLVVRDNSEIVELKPVRNPIAGYVKEKDFETELFAYQASDMFYLFTDGITDQFSADGTYSLGMKGFKEILAKHAREAEKEQKAHILSDFNAFRGSSEQVDDILLVGVRGSAL